MSAMTFSIIIPVYRNEESLPVLVAKLDELVDQLAGTLEVVFVVDGSPDRSFAVLRDLLPRARFASQLLHLSRNFGSFSAIASGLEVARGEYFAIIAADLQDPPELAVEFFQALLEGDCDLVLGKREARGDPWLSRTSSRLFWALYRNLVQRDMPRGGVDVFACNRVVRDQLLELRESNSTLVGLLMWIGFRRRSISYTRAVRPFGKSAWSFARKLRYLKDSVFAFSDLPVRGLGLIGIVGLVVAFLLGAVVVVSKLTGGIDVPGYAASAILIMFFGGLNSLGIAIVGEYLWRTFENTKQRPRYIVSYATSFSGAEEKKPANAATA
jgi:glycosyltransferase involved in cell wall biosynthesis